MKVETELDIYEINGSDTLPALEKEKLRVTSHWSINRRINLEIDGKTITVIADDLRRAIENATNITP